MSDPTLTHLGEDVALAESEHLAETQWRTDWPPPAETEPEPFVGGGW